MAGPSLEEISPGLFRLEFFTPEDVQPALNQSFVPRLLEASALGPVVLLVFTPPQLRLVGSDVIMFWMENFTSRGIKCAGVCVVTKSSAVRVAANGFSLAMKLRGSPLAVECFSDAERALDWCQRVTPKR